MSQGNYSESGINIDIMAEDILSDDPNDIVLAPVKRKKGAKSKIQHNVTHGVVHIVATFVLVCHGSQLMCEEWVAVNAMK